MNMRNLGKFAPYLVSILFGYAFVAEAVPANFDSLLGYVMTRVLNPLLVVIFAFGLVKFSLGALTYVGKEGKDRDAARDSMVNGIVILAVMVGVWGLVNVVLGTFDLNNSSQIPTIPKLR